MEQLHTELGKAHAQQQVQEQLDQLQLKLLRAHEDMSKWCVCEREREREKERERLRREFMGNGTGYRAVQGVTCILLLI